MCALRLITMSEEEKRPLPAQAAAPSAPAQLNQPADGAGCPADENGKPRATAREIAGFNRTSERVHGRLERRVSHARFSLTLRVAAHYCAQLARSALLLLLALSLAWGLAQHSWVQRSITALQRQEAAGTPLESITLSDGAVHARPLDEAVPQDWWPRLGFRLRTALSQAGSGIYCRPFDLSGGGRALAMFHMQERLTWLLWLWLAAIAADLLRMLYLLRHHHRLDNALLTPIREITEMTETISANNLSNHINEAGTKNELRDLAVVINRMLDRIETSYNSQKQFVSDASHELRTPIAVIRGYADMLRRWGKEDPEVLEEGLNAISSEADSMKDLVENLLFLARHDKKTLLLELTAFDPCEVVEEVKREAELVNSKDHFSLSAADHCQLEADRNMVKQVLRVLVDNAVKYSPEGSEIVLGCACSGKDCVLTVADNGNGIAEEDLPHVFDRFYRADKARKAESGGHGLGLSIARIIVVAHSGKIHVRSKLGEGTVFSVKLPLRQEGSGQVEAAVEEQPEKKRRKRGN